MKSRLRRHTKFRSCLFAAVFLIAMLRAAVADDSVPRDEEPRGYPNIKSKTLGGIQFWGDERLFHDWRIQRNVYSGLYRLLDGKDVRYAWGNLAHCEKVLEKIKREQELAPMKGKAVIALHGLVNNRKSMQGLCKYLEDEGEYTTFDIAYPSTRREIGEHAKMLARIIDSLDGVEEINFVAHSMGNLVIRHYLADQTDMARGLRPDPRINRIVMLGPPNQGAEFARRMKDNGIFKLVWGVSGKQLANKWEDVEKRLATPHCQFAIIAGGKETDRGLNPVLEGDDDFVVTVEETRLVGARDFRVVPAMHTFLTKNDDVRKFTLNFLQHGSFESDAKRQPITAKALSKDQRR